MYDDGRGYRQTFDEVCNTLQFESDADEVRGQLINLESVAESCFRSVLFTQAAILAGVFAIAVGFTFDIRNQDWSVKGGIVLVAVLLGVIVYWAGKFALWYEVSRHLKTRRFGDPNCSGDTILSFNRSRNK